MFRLERLTQFLPRTGPLLLIIMDGIGIGKEDDGNAVFLAKPKTLRGLTEECKKKNLYFEIKAHGTAVGLPSDTDMGNSEVGHNALGAGQIYDQGAKLVDSSIKSKEIFQSENWKTLIGNVIINNKTVHLLGLLSDGNVHSNISQLFGILDGLSDSGVKKVRIHILTDGRDVPANSSLDYVRKLELKLEKINLTFKKSLCDYQIASGGGRMYVSMDRYESDWKIVQRGWNAHVRGIVEKEELINGYIGYYKSAQEALLHAKQCFPEKNDQTLPPFVIIDDKNEPLGKMVDGDLVINFNFRGDRALQISNAFEEKDFNKFARTYKPNVVYVGITQYDGDKLIPKKFLVQPPNIREVLTEYCCANGVNSFAIAETHKFGHITYFWNGNRSGYINHRMEKYLEIHSEPNELIESKPQMKASEVCDATIDALHNGKYKFLRVNFANGDMVGHTGNIESCIKAVSVVDQCIEKLKATVNSLNGITVITADHGNCEDKKFPDGKPKTAHSLNPVGFWIVDKNWNNEYKINPFTKEPSITNVTATILNLLGFKKPEKYRDSLIRLTALEGL